jgi:hypothetical protein
MCRAAELLAVLLGGQMVALLLSCIYRCEVARLSLEQAFPTPGARLYPIANFNVRLEIANRFKQLPWRRPLQSQ